RVGGGSGALRGGLGGDVPRLDRGVGEVALVEGVAGGSAVPVGAADQPVPRVVGVGGGAAGGAAGAGRGAGAVEGVRVGGAVAVDEDAVGLVAHGMCLKHGARGVGHAVALQLAVVEVLPGGLLLGGVRAGGVGRGDRTGGLPAGRGPGGGDALVP